MMDPMSNRVHGSNYGSDTRARAYTYSCVP
jgi:hypothetical protein